MNDTHPENIDDMHHALGRPKNVKKESYRNHYCVGVGTETEKFMASSKCWEFRGRINDDRDAFYSVTDYGREILEREL